MNTGGLPNDTFPKCRFCDAIGEISAALTFSQVLALAIAAASR